MIRVEGGRAVLRCDHGRCPARIDLGSAAQVKYNQARIPTGWRTVGLDRHECSLHDLGNWMPGRPR